MGASACKGDSSSTQNEVIRNLDPKTRKIVKLLQQYKIDLDPHVEDGNKIVLTGSHNKFSIRNTNKLGSSGVSNLNKIFREATFKEIQVLFISGGDMSLSKFSSGLPTILKTVKKQVLISAFKIDKRMLKLVIENSANVENLALCFSEIEGVSKKWKLDNSISYNIKSLDLFGSCHRSWSDHLTEKKLDKFIRALSETSLKESLKTIHTKEDWFSARNLQPIFDKYGFTVHVIGDNNKPSPMD